MVRRLAAGLLRGAPFLLQLDQMRVDVFGGRLDQVRLQPGIDAADDGVDRGGTGVEHVDDLLLAQLTVADVGANQRGRIVDRIAMTRERLTRLQVQHAPQRLHVLPQIAAMRRRNRDRAAVDQQIAAEHHRRARLVEADMIGRVARRVNHPQRAVAGAHDRFVLERLERHAAARVHLAWQLREHEIRPSPPQRRDSRHVIAVRMRDEHALQHRARLLRFQRLGHARGIVVAVLRRVDERRLLAGQQPRVGAAARQRSRIVAADTDPSIVSFLAVCSEIRFQLHVARSRA